MACEICEWNEGYCERHHIIPLKDNGKDIEENIMILCPNHHSEATKLGYKLFNLKYNILRGIFDNKELLNDIALFYYSFFERWNADNPNTIIAIKQNKEIFEYIIKVCKENNWDEIDMLSQLLGTNRRNFINTRELS